MIIDYYARQKLARILAQQQNLILRYEDIDMPRTDGEFLYVPRPNVHWTEEQMALWEYKVEHETGHNDPDMRDIFDLSKDKKIAFQGNLLGYIINLLDDHRQERHKIDEFAGRKEIRSRGRSLWVKDCQKRIKPNTEDRAQKAASALFAWDTKERERFMPHVNGLAERLVEELDSEGTDIYNTLQAFSSDLKNIKTAVDEYELAKKILDTLGFDSEQEEQKARQKYKEAEKCPGEEKGSSGGEKLSEKDREAKIHFDQLLFHSHDITEGGTTFTPLTIDYDDYSSPEYYVPRPEEEMRILDFKEKSSESYTGTNYRQAIEKTQTANGLASKVRKLLQIKSKSKYSYGQKRGKIHNKNIYRTCIRSK